MENNTTKKKFLERLNKILNLIGDTNENIYYWYDPEFTPDLESKIKKLDNNVGSNNHITLKDLGVIEYAKTDTPPETTNYFNGWQCHGFALYISSLCSGENVLIQTTNPSTKPSDWTIFEKIKTAV